MQTITAISTRKFVFSYRAVYEILDTRLGIAKHYISPDLCHDFVRSLNSDLLQKLLDRAILRSYMLRNGV